MIVLDSGTIIDFLRNQPQAVEKLASLREEPEELVVTVFSAYEALRGERFYGSPKTIEGCLAFLLSFRILEFDFSAMEEAVEVEYQLRKRGTPIKLNDLYIAAICLANRASLLTPDKKHFKQVSGLKVLHYS